MEPEPVYLTVDEPDALELMSQPSGSTFHIGCLAELYMLRLGYLSQFDGTHSTEPDLPSFNDESVFVKVCSDEAIALLVMPVGCMPAL